MQSDYQLGMFSTSFHLFLDILQDGNYQPESSTKDTWLFIEGVLIAAWVLLLPGPLRLGNLFVCVSVNI